MDNVYMWVCVCLTGRLYTVKFWSKNWSITLRVIKYAVRISQKRGRWDERGIERWVRIKYKSMMNSTLVVFRLLCSLHGLSDLHSDDVDLGLAVLQHLLSRLEKLLILWRDIKTRGDQEDCLKEHRGKTVKNIWKCIVQCCFSFHPKKKKMSMLPYLYCMVKWMQ